MFTKSNVTREQMDKIFDILSEVIGGMTSTGKEVDTKQLIANRKYVLAQIIEIYSGWKDRLDCLPDLIQVGAYNPKFLRIVEVDVYGRVLE
jgi:hypothetical protein